MKSVSRLNFVGTRQSLRLVNKDIYVKLAISVIPQSLTDCIKQSKRVIVLLTEDLLNSDWTSLSLDVAMKNRIPIIFVRKEGRSNEELLNQPMVSQAAQVSIICSVK